MKQLVQLKSRRGYALAWEWRVLGLRLHLRLTDWGRVPFSIHLEPDL